MKNVAVICCIYNNLPLAKECVEQASKLACGVGQFILIDNHGLDPELQPWLKSIIFQPVQTGCVFTIVDDGENLGCHRGFNRGLSELLPQIDYVVKLDDDTFIRTQDWDRLMVAGLESCSDVAYLSADIDPAAKQNNKYETRKFGDLVYEITDNGIVGFSCVMFRRADLDRWGPMRGAHELPGAKGLYGGEEQHAANMARKEGKLVAHFPPVYCDHAKNENRHPDYPMWKWVYGYRRWTDLGMREWLALPAAELLAQYRKRLGEEMRGQPMNVDFVEYTIARLAVLGNSVDSRKLNELALSPKIVADPKLQQKFFQASSSIDQRG